jgi:hypothetical protein
LQGVKLARAALAGLISPLNINTGITAKQKNFDIIALIFNFINNKFLKNNWG